MLESSFLFIGRIAFLWTVIVVFGSSYFDRAADDIAIVGGTIGFVLWGVWTFGTLNVEVANGATVYEFASPALTFVGIAMALVPGYLAISGPIELISRYRDGDMRDI